MKFFKNKDGTGTNYLKVVGTLLVLLVLVGIAVYTLV